MLLIKIADGNPRIKQGSADLFVTIASSYHIIPHSALPLLLSSFSTVSATSLSKGLGNVGKQRANAGGDKVGVDADVHWRFIKARLDLLAKCISEFGIDEDESANDGTAAGASSADPPSGKKSTANVELAAAKKAESSLKKRLKGLNVDVKKQDQE